MVTDTTSAADAFVESYRAAFERMDVAAIVDHFAFPCHITSDAGEIGVMVIAGNAEWATAIEQLAGMYRAIGVSSVHVLDRAVTELSPRLTQVFVRWALYDGSRAKLYSFEAAYTVASIGGALRITAISHNEIPRYRECLVRIRSGAG